MEELDIVLETKLEASKADKHLAKALYDLSSSAFQGTRHQLIQEANTTLYLCLNNPSPSIRLLGVKKLVDVLKSGDSAMLQVNRKYIKEREMNDWMSNLFPFAFHLEKSLPM
jgi:hypothetical protein